MWAHAHWNSSVLFRFALVYRFFSSLFVSTYFNPDEYWQNQEVATRWVYGVGELTWEWLPYAKIRGFLHPSLTAAVYTMLKTLGLDSRWMIAWSPRLIQAFVTSISDVFLYKLARRWCHQDTQVPKWVMFLYYTCWFNFYCATRPFSNSMETALFIIALYYFPFPSKNWSPHEHILLSIPRIDSIAYYTDWIRRFVTNPFEEFRVKRQSGHRLRSPHVLNSPARLSSHDSDMRSVGNSTGYDGDQMSEREQEPRIVSRRSRWKRPKIVIPNEIGTNDHEGHERSHDVDAAHLNPDAELELYISPSSGSHGRSHTFSPTSPVSNTKPRYVVSPISSHQLPHEVGWDIVLEGHSVSFILISLCVMIRPTSLAYIFFLFVPFVVSAVIGEKQDKLSSHFVLKKALFIAFLAVVISTLFDSLIYAIVQPSHERTFKFKNFLVFVPWNFFRFNSMHDIGALYGTHPWHWNFTQGFPAMLAGALPLCFLGSLADIFALLLSSDEKSAIESSKYNNSEEYPSNGEELKKTQNLNSKGKTKISRAPTVIVLIILCIFSFQSHKEFRFLLPALPLAMFPAARYAARLSIALRRHSIWVVYLGFLFLSFLGLSVYFGLVHQRGPIAAVEYISKDISLSNQSNSTKQSGVLFFMPCHSTPYLSFFQGSNYTVDLVGYEKDITFASTVSKQPSTVLHYLECSPYFAPPAHLHLAKDTPVDQSWKLIGNGMNPNASSHILSSLQGNTSLSALRQLEELFLKHLARVENGLSKNKQQVSQAIASKNGTEVQLTPQLTVLNSTGREVDINLLQDVAHIGHKIGDELHNSLNDTESIKVINIEVEKARQAENRIYVVSFGSQSDFGRSQRQMFIRHGFRRVFVNIHHPSTFLEMASALFDNRDFAPREELQNGSNSNRRSIDYESWVEVYLRD